jgi:nucleoside-diphosphate-sugar epimerase
MKIAVTGATGNVGTSLVDLLAADDGVEEIVGVVRRPPAAGAWHPPKTHFVAADVANDDLRPAFRDVDAVVHLAWLFQPSHSPMVTWHANAEGSTRVFEAVAETGVRTLVHASSVGAYSPASPTADDRPVDESWPTNSVPTAAYGREKAYVERVLDVFEARHPQVRVVRLRPAFIFKRPSATQQRRLFAGPLVPGSIAGARRLPIVPLPAGLRFQALHADDAAEAYRLALFGDVRGAFNIASSPVVDTDTLARLVGGRPVLVPRPLVRAAVAAAWRLHLVPTQPELLDLALSLPVMATERARDELGWSPRHGAIDALESMLAGLATGAGGPTPPLQRDTPGARLDEVATGVGERP